MTKEARVYHREKTGSSISDVGKNRQLYEKNKTKIKEQEEQKKTSLTLVCYLNKSSQEANFGGRCVIVPQDI